MNATVIRNARVDGQPGLVDIALEDDRINGLVSASSTPGLRVIDAGGRIVLPGFVDSHMHLDKAFTLEDAPNHSGTLDEAVAIFRDRKKKFTPEDLKGRARRLAEMASSHGTTALRTHADVEETVGLMGLAALLEVKEEFAGRVDIQVVAFPSIGSLDKEANRELLEEALRLGADVVGGNPTRDADHIRHIDAVFALAQKYDRPIDMHVDESDNPKDLALEYLAEKTLREGYRGKVAAGHCCSLAAVDDGTAGRVIEKVREADISVITLPSCNLYLQGRRDRYPIRRGLTRVKELLAAGVNVAYASDNVKDPFNPFGKADMLQIAHLTAHAAHLGGMEEQRTVLRMGTYHAARVLGLDRYGLSPGCRADLTMLDTRSFQDVIADQPNRVLVFKDGKSLLNRLGTIGDPTLS